MRFPEARMWRPSGHRFERIHGNGGGCRSIAIGSKNPIVNRPFDVEDGDADQTTDEVFAVDRDAEARSVVDEDVRSEGLASAARHPEDAFEYLVSHIELQIAEQMPCFRIAEGRARGHPHDRSGRFEAAAGTLTRRVRPSNIRDKVPAGCVCSHMDPCPGRSRSNAEELERSLGSATVRVHGHRHEVGFDPRNVKMVPPPGFEPGTCRVGGGRSVQLSYGGVGDA